MDKEEQEQREFEVALFLADFLIRDLKVFSLENYFDPIRHDLEKAGLNDELALLRILNKQVDAYNSQVQATISRLSKMRYTRKWRGSALFQGIDINFRKIEQEVKDNPETSAYNLSLKMIKATSK